MIKIIKMLNKFKRGLLIMGVCLVSFFTNAQTVVATKSDSVDVMRSNGKIFVVMAVILIIMTGFFIYLISVDRKVSKLEKEL